MVKNRQRSNFRKNTFEQVAWHEKKVVCGIDEVGRGCLAGPVVAAAVILPVYKTNRLLKDSKVLTKKERIKAYKWITRHCWYNIGIVHNRLVDQYNIWQATLIAMRKALIHLLATSPQRPVFILVDAMPLRLFNTAYNAIPVYYFPQGEAKSSSIAAASIIAKVTRDTIAQRLDTIFPGYHLSSNKGYGTKLHTAAIYHHSYSLIHRMSFLKKIISHNKKEKFHEKQQSLC